MSALPFSRWAYVRVSFITWSIVRSPRGSACTINDISLTLCASFIKKARPYQRSRESFKANSGAASCRGHRAMMDDTPTLSQCQKILNELRTQAGHEQVTCIRPYGACGERVPSGGGSRDLWPVGLGEHGHVMFPLPTGWEKRRGKRMGGVIQWLDVGHRWADKERSVHSQLTSLTTYAKTET